MLPTCHANSARFAVSADTGTTKQSQQNVIACTLCNLCFQIQFLPIPSSHLSCIERKNPSSSKVALKGISGFLRWSSPTLKAKPDMSTGNRRNGLFLPTKPVTHDIDCRIVKPPVYQSKIFTRTDKVRWKWGCFIFFSFASSVYQSSCTISAISAQRPVKHVKNAFQNITG